jgi:hypothetical protein
MVGVVVMAVMVVRVVTAGLEATRAIAEMAHRSWYLALSLSFHFVFFHLCFFFILFVPIVSSLVALLHVPAAADAVLRFVPPHRGWVAQVGRAWRLWYHCLFYYDSF